jgi:hypothetical protein
MHYNTYSRSMQYLFHYLEDSEGWCGVGVDASAVERTVDQARQAVQNRLEWD